MLKGAWNWIELACSFSIAKGKILVIPEHFQFPFTSEQISHIQHVPRARLVWELPWETFSWSVSRVFAIQTWKRITPVIATTQIKKKTALAYDWWADRKWMGSLELLRFLISYKIIYALEWYEHLLEHRPIQTTGSIVVEENVQHAEYPNRAVRMYHHINWTLGSTSAWCLRVCIASR